jgi:hypothetical protein
VNLFCYSFQIGFYWGFCFLKSSFINFSKSHLVSRLCCNLLSWQTVNQKNRWINYITLVIIHSDYCLETVYCCIQLMF